MHAEYDRPVYTLARNYLLGQEGIFEDLLDRQVHPSLASHKPLTLAGVYERLLRSAQSAQNMPNVIGGSIGEIERLSIVLHGFDPSAVAERYPRSEEGQTQLQPAQPVEALLRDGYIGGCFSRAISGREGTLIHRDYARLAALHVRIELEADGCIILYLRDASI
jgi:hypothetical protein